MRLILNKGDKFFSYSQDEEQQEFSETVIDECLYIQQKALVPVVETTLSYTPVKPFSVMIRRANLPVPTMRDNGHGGFNYVHYTLGNIYVDEAPVPNSSIDYQTGVIRVETTDSLWASYEFIVSENEVTALPMRERLAIHDIKVDSTRPAFERIQVEQAGQARKEPK